MDTLAPAERARIAELAARSKDRAGALLPVLHDVQEAMGFIPPAAVPVIAKVLGLSRAEVQGTLSFYHHFRSTPPGRHILQVCRAEACQSMRGDAVAERARARLGVEFGGTTTDGAMTLQAVYCLGNCACAPAALLDGELHGRLSPAALDALLDGLPDGPGVLP